MLVRVPRCKNRAQRPQPQVPSAAMAPARRGGAVMLAIGPSSRFTLANLAAVAAGPAQVDLDASALEALPVPKVRIKAF